MWERARTFIQKTTRFKFEVRNPCLRRSGFAQAGEARNKFECSKFKSFKKKGSNRFWEFGYLNFEIARPVKYVLYNFGCDGSRSVWKK
jgi:hypothetical protein